MKSLQTITSFPEGITLLVPAIFPSLVATLLIVTSLTDKLAWSSFENPVNYSSFILTLVSQS